jgi:hypothetical protein
MGRLLASWLLLLVVVSGCIDRHRVNANCEWTGDTSFPFDPQNPAHQQHLITDAQLAEELAIRYADAKHKRLFGYEGHGGLIENGRLRERCMATLVDVIEKRHAVAAEQVRVARGQRHRTFDLAVGLLFLPLYWFGATVVCRRLSHRFSSDQRYVGLVATGLASIAVSFLGLQLGQLWLSVWEAIRVENGHLSSFRAATHNRWSQQHVGALFVGGILMFWLSVLSCRRVPRTLSLGAAMLACTMVGAVFLHTFVQPAVGYVLAPLVLLGMFIAVRFAGRFSAGSEARPD